MTAFFESIKNFFESLWHTITLIFDAIVAVLNFLWALVSYVIDVFGSLPVIIYVSLCVILVIYIIYKIVGR